MTSDADRDAVLTPKIRRLQGPILVLGGSGFVGGNLFHALRARRDDVLATTTRLPAWRLEGTPPAQVRQLDLLVDSNLDALLKEVRPRTIFDCVAYGAYSFETDAALIYRTNFHFLTRLLPRLEARSIAGYVHAGSSSEYGGNAAGPSEGAFTEPNSDYAVSKVAASGLLSYYGKQRKFPCTNLRLYSVYGPLEDPSRLIPTLIRCGLGGTYPEFVNPAISRDFIYVDDVSEAFIDAALNLAPAGYGESWNIGTGVKTTIAEIAALARQLYGIQGEPAYTMPERRWDVADWFANIKKARHRLGWLPRTALDEGLRRATTWYKSLPDKQSYHQASKQFGRDTVYSVSAIAKIFDEVRRPLFIRRNIIKDGEVRSATEHAFERRLGG